MSEIVLKNDCDDLKVDGIAYDGGKIDLPGWKFPVVVDLAGMMLSDSIPLLASNNSGVDAFIANTLPEIKDNRLVIRGDISCSCKSAVRIICGLFNAVAGWTVHIMADVKECELVTKTREVNGSVFEGNFYHVQKSVLRKIVIEPNCQNSLIERAAALSDWREEDEPATNDNQLPKLTVEVFDREDCPAWAKYAAVDEDGMVVLFEHRPTIAPTGKWWDRKEKYCPLGGRYDCSDWTNSLIARPEKKETLPDWCKVGEWGYNTSRGFYFEIVKISDNHIEVKYPHITNECYKLTIEYFKQCDPFQARLRPYNEEEMQGLVGKVVGNDRGDMLLVTAFVAYDRGEVCVDGVVYNADDLLECYTIDGAPCGKFEHLENGKWVE